MSVGIRQEKMAFLFAFIVHVAPTCAKSPPLEEEVARIVGDKGKASRAALAITSGSMNTCLVA